MVTQPAFRDPDAYVATPFDWFLLVFVIVVLPLSVWTAVREFRHKRRKGE